MRRADMGITGAGNFEVGNRSVTMPPVPQSRDGIFIF